MKKIFITLLLITQAISVFSQLDTLNTIPPPNLDISHDEVTIYTPADREADGAYVLKSGYELTSTLKQAARAYCDSFYNYDLTFLGEATNTYNCHGYAWHIIENEIVFEAEYDTVWLKYEVHYWTQHLKQSYEEVSWRENAKIRFQNQSDHSAIATDDEDIIISKWGNLPLFKHDIDDCPYHSNLGLKYYWIKKPVISDPPESLDDGERHKFSETRFVANNILGMTYYWRILGSGLTQIGPNGTSEYDVEATSYVGTGTLCLIITTPSGQTNSDTIEITLNPPPPAPDPDDFEVYIEELGGSGVPGSPDGPFELCEGEQYYVSLYPYHLFDDYGITDIEFDFTFDYDVLDEGDDYIEIEVNSSPEDEEGEVYVTSMAAGYTTFKFMDFEEGSCGSYFMMFTPNPTVAETTVSIEPKSTAITFDETAEWEIEVYSETQILKEKKTKLIGNEHKLKTHNWKEGVYFVRIKYKDEILQGKLVVKK